MKSYGMLGVLVCICFEAIKAQCSHGQALTFSRWSGVTPERPTPVFIYTASGDETSLTGACLARCRELQDCAAVAVAFGRGSCQGVARVSSEDLRVDSDVAYFQKICLDLPASCSNRWWVLETTPGYHLHSEGAHQKMLNATIQECYAAVLTPNSERLFRSAQWIGKDNSVDAELIQTSERAIGNCILNAEDKFTEPESYRVANYQTFYVENQCRHDYSKKIDRCSYEEYYNQTLRHVEYSLTNHTKDECKTACELEDRFVCRGFTWSRSQGRNPTPQDRGLCDLHSEDLVTTGSWLLRKSTFATYYRRVICLNITVECEDANLIITYRPRGTFRGRVYVPGRGDHCAARASNGLVRLPLPLYGDCDVNFAHAISHSPSGVINRTMAYVMVMIQNNPIIQTAGDRWVRVGCSPTAGARPAAVDATIAVRDQGKPTSASEVPSPQGQSASAVFNSPTTPALSMYVVRDEAAPAAPAVALGEPLELRVELQDSTEIEAYHLVASSRLGDSSVLLLDSRGCPTGQVDFPPLTRSWLGGTQRLSARFKAFRFPTSHVVRFALMVRYCDDKCPPLNCQNSKANRSARMTNGTTDGFPAFVSEESSDAWQGGVVAQGGEVRCGGPGLMPLELELVVGSKDLLSADTLVRADHRSAAGEGPDTVAAATAVTAAGVVCVHELLLVALALAWLAVQVLLLLGCCVLVKRYRNLAEMSMQKEYQTFDNVGFDTVSTHRRVHWPDESHILHTSHPVS